MDYHLAKTNFPKYVKEQEEKQLKSYNKMISELKNED